MLNREELARNILQMLQAHPERYRSFGIYWWVVKKLLKGFYGPENLYLLGDYFDPSADPRMPSVDSDEMLRRAIREHQRNMTYPPSDPGRVFDANGEVYVLFDEDAGQ